MQVEHSRWPRRHVGAEKGMRDIGVSTSGAFTKRKKHRQAMERIGQGRG